MVSGDLNGIGPEPSGAEHHGELARFQPRLANRAVGRYSGTQQWRGLSRLEALGNRCRPALLKDRVFRKAAVGIHPGAFDFGAMGLVAGQAFLAIAARAVHIAGADPLARLQTCHAGAKLHDGSDPLVSEDHRVLAWDGVISLPEVQVRMAETAHVDPDQHFTCTGPGDREISDFERLTRGGCDRRLHQLGHRYPRLVEYRGRDAARMA